MELFRQFLSSDDSKIYDIHIHDSYEIYFVDTDNVDVIFENMHFETSIGDIFIFPPFTFHKIDAKGKPYKRHVAHFDNEYMMLHSPCSMPLLDYVAQFKPLYVHLTKAQCTTLRTMIKEHLEYVDTPSRFQYFNVVYSLSSIIKFVVEIHIKSGGQPPDFIKSDNNIISRILKYLHENYTYDVTVEDVARKFKISKSTLYNTFTEYIGISFKEYLIRLRITKAMGLLKSGVSVTETANLSGFNSYAHFIRTFSKRTGISPKQFALQKSDISSTDYLRYWEDY